MKLLRTTKNPIARKTGIYARVGPESRSISQAEVFVNCFCHNYECLASLHGRDCDSTRRLRTKKFLPLSLLARQNPLSKGQLKLYCSARNPLGRQSSIRLRCRMYFQRVRRVLHEITERLFRPEYFQPFTISSDHQLQSNRRLYK